MLGAFEKLQLRSEAEGEFQYAQIRWDRLRSKGDGAMHRRSGQGFLRCPGAVFLGGLLQRRIQPVDRHRIRADVANFSPSDLPLPTGVGFRQTRA